jgi:nucleolin
MARLFVGNIPHGASPVEIQQLIEVHGFKTCSAEIICDRATGHSRGFGFVELSEEWRLKEAVESLHGLCMNGRTLTINCAVPRADPIEQNSRRRKSA